jgi:hypothetical protein
MGYHQRNVRLFFRAPKRIFSRLGNLFYFVAAILILNGCVPRIRKPVLVCPGADSAIDSLSLLRLRSENTVPLRANGQCRLQYYDAEGKKHNENFPVKLWMNPPAEIYMQGDVAFNAKGVVLGSNEDEFWLSIKPKASTYVWGQWSDEVYPEELMINPKLVLEAIGITEVSGEENWSSSNDDAFDVLTRRDGHTETQKIYISNDDCLVKRIEYFDAGRVVVDTELDEYEEVSEGFSVPAVIKIVTGTTEAAEDSINITFSLKSIKPANINLKQRNRLFTRPKPRRFKHIYKIVNGDMIEQPQ